MTKYTCAHPGCGLQLKDGVAVYKEGDYYKCIRHIAYQPPSDKSQLAKAVEADNERVRALS